MLPSGARPKKHDAPNAMTPSRIPYSFHNSWLYACINHAVIVHDEKGAKTANRTWARACKSEAPNSDARGLAHMEGLNETV